MNIFKTVGAACIFFKIVWATKLPNPLILEKDIFNSNPTIGTTTLILSLHNTMYARIWCAIASSLRIAIKGENDIFKGEELVLCCNFYCFEHGENYFLSVSLNCLFVSVDDFHRKERGYSNRDFAPHPERAYNWNLD